MHVIEISLRHPHPSERNLHENFVAMVDLGVSGGLGAGLQNDILRQLVSVSDSHSMQCKEIMRSQEDRLAASDRQVCPHTSRYTLSFKP